MVSNGSGGFVNTPNSGSSSGFIGFNPSSLENNYNTISQYMHKLLCEHRANFYVTLCGIEEHWCSPEAINYCNGLAIKMNKYISDTTERLIKILNDIKKAGELWAQKSKASISLPSKDSYMRDLPKIESHAQEHINGIVGADVNWFLTSLHDRFDDPYTSSLNKKITAMASDFGFVGNGQSEQLRSSLDSIMLDNCRRMDELSNDLVREINDIAKKYEDTAGRIGDSFKKIYDALGYE